MLAMNVLRPLGRERLGCSVGLFGNGFAVRREALEQVPFSGGSITEDLDYHLRLVHAGYRARFVDSTTVWAEAVTHSRESASQRIRWEGGRLHAGADTGCPRLVRGIAAGRLRLVEPLLDLLTLPLAYHAGAARAARGAALDARPDLRCVRARGARAARRLSPRGSGAGSPI